mmetsp:Transcript_13853/g.38416  ORF Transcript_13853/g.38416 Transcript_13853/m.38416 type:complete len:232 (-) Transcript_13853:169-864(-)
MPSASTAKSIGEQRRVCELPSSPAEDLHIVWGSLDRSPRGSDSGDSNPWDPFFRAQALLQARAPPPVPIIRLRLSPGPSASSSPRSDAAGPLSPDTLEESDDSAGAEAASGADDGAGIPVDREAQNSLAAPEDRAPAWSVGAAGHSNGKCKPCAWFWKDSSCSNGRTCTFCHMCPSTELRARKEARISYLKERRRQGKERAMLRRAEMAAAEADGRKPKPPKKPLVAGRIS